MPAESHASHPSIGSPSDRRAISPSDTYDLKSAGIIFGGVALSLAGIFGVLELSSRHHQHEFRAIHTRLDTHQDAIATVNQRVGRLETTVDQKFLETNKRIEAVAQKVERAEIRMEAQFAKVDERFAGVDGRFASLEKKIDKMGDLLIRLVEDRTTGDSPRAGRHR